ncbi:membrane-associated protein, putative, partial [Bodo saltans]
TLLPVWTAALPSLASSFTVLAAAQASDDNGHCLPPDIVLIIAGVAFSAAPALTIISVWHWKAHPASDTNENNVVEPSWVCFEVAPVPQIRRRQPSALRSLTKLLRQSTRRAWKWRHSNVEKQQVQALRCETSLRAALVLLLDFRLLWYAGAVDQATLVVVSALAVAAGQDNTNRALCISCTSTVVGVLAAQFLVIVRCRPFTTIFSCIFALATVMLTCLGVFAQLMFVVMSPSTVSGLWMVKKKIVMSPSTVSGLWMVQASVACTLAVVSLSSVKMVLDAAEVIAAVHRRLSIVCSCTSSSQNPYKEPAIKEEMSEVLGKYDANVALSTPRLQSIIVKEVHPPQQDLDEEEDEDEWWRLGRGLDKFFWRDDGTAKCF